MEKALAAENLSAAAFLRKMGTGWPSRLALDPGAGSETDRFLWLAACLLRAGDRREDRVETALAALASAGLDAAEKVATGGASLTDALAAAELRRPEVLAAQLSRCSAALVEGAGGSLDTLAAEGPSLEELGARLVRLGPGLGPGTVLRFLRALRDRWPAADETPLDPAALAAGAHLGWLDEWDDLEGAPSLLRRRLDDEADAPPLPAVEEALERLGKAACRKGRAARCPLRGACPARE